MMVSDELKKIVENFQVDRENCVHNDHQASCILLRLRAPKKLSKPKCKINFQKSMNPSVRKYFNKKLKYTLDNCVDLRYEEIGNYVKSSAKDIATEIVKENYR